MNLPVVRGTAASVLLVLSLSLPARAADDCSAWKAAYATYEDEVYAAIRDEPEDLLQELRRHAKAIASGYTEQAEKIETKIRGGLRGLIAIDPHPDMTRFHADLVECYRKGVSVLDAENRGDGPGRRAAELRTWRAFRGLFVTMRDLLSEQGCGAGDIAAIDRNYLSQIEAQIEALRDRTGDRTGE